MQSEFVAHDQAIELNRLGYDGECLKYEDVVNVGNLCIPTYNASFNWFKAKYDILGYALIKGIGPDRKARYQFAIITKYDYQEMGDYELYEQAQRECLWKLIKMI